ncbi:calcium/sodium antiporter [Stutzerimonas xanthomarina]|uniref:calcium/sodium antiporter n=1 Tax=Stutzerimonas xanthomarina TaxID=271420 RepID=UPI00190D7957|nr:calcium/sodium antiporter [Stutzerimonas xanthomarina]MBU0810272.1 calcium/sodium antiporter [Gammaproteobacteria bacterium]MBK3845218.1 calcium/sodium antiporter [Stutzerimonas xanthomarina]MBK3846345.1 calcium/sodium antiporter [Stutzerimonas xanthomarina]MBU0850802.1 calcium/sodium antiporter [Gammaproteobacteria bacterium]MBU1774536.1 calcium/sodium antiporter [Gammaproteobacteria bacterium]
MSAMTFVYLIAGLVLLVAGAEVLVRGAAKLAAQFGIPPLIIGLTVVAFGTSAPETAVSVQAALNGSGDIAIGNVLGSNIANVLLILGVTSLVAPLIVSRQLIRLDVPIMIGASLVTYALAWDGSLSRLDGALLFSAVIAYTAFLIISSRRATAAATADDEFAKEFGLDETPKPYASLINAGLVVAGLVLLVTGSNFLVEGAVSLARALGLSELVIGLTVIAIGTSLPELATSILAAIRGERDIAVGNIVGSNIFNLLCVLGLASLVSPNAIGVAANALAFDFPVMIAVALACLPIFFTGYAINRWEGLLFVAYYVAYTVYLVLVSTGRPLAEVFGDAMIGYVVPLTMVTLLVISGRAWKTQRN